MCWAIIHQFPRQNPNHPSAFTIAFPVTYQDLGKETRGGIEGFTSGATWRSNFTLAIGALAVQNIVEANNPLKSPITVALPWFLSYVTIIGEKKYGRRENNKHIPRLRANACTFLCKIVWTSFLTIFCPACFFSFQLFKVDLWFFKFKIFELGQLVNGQCDEILCDSAFYTLLLLPSFHCRCWWWNCVVEIYIYRIRIM